MLLSYFSTFFGFLLVLFSNFPAPPESFQFPQCQKRLLTLNGLANQSEQMVIVGAVVQHFPA